MTIRTRVLLLLLPLLTGFLILNSFFFYFHWSRETIFMGLGLLLVLVTGTVFAIADRISEPVRQLNRAALKIAAGDYETSVSISGPKEIVELAQTLNTMGQCLIEHMSRLKESSLIRERMYGEYECSLLLQHYMLNEVIDEFNHPSIAMRLISLPQSPLKKGLFLKAGPTPTSDLTITLLESSEIGFAGLFQLSQEAHLLEKNSHKFTFIELQFVDLYTRLRYDIHTLFPPLVWSVKHQRFIKSENHEFSLTPLDMVFIYNSSLIDYFESERAIEEWFARALRNFSEEGLEMIQVMLTNELSFIAKKQHVKHNFKIIGLQVESL